VISRRLVIGFLPLLAASFVQAQDATPDSGVVIQSESRMVLVDTIVTDKKGDYVRNLTAKDFKVWEDNKEQTIKTFSWEAGAANLSNPQRRYIVLFFDASTIGFGNQAQARQAAAKFIDANAGPNRMMAIVNFGGALQIAQNFTDDADRLKAVAAGQKVSAVGNSGSDGIALSRAAADFGANDLLLSLRSLAKNLNSIPGRKTLILFTGGFPLTPERMSEATATIDACNKSNVAIYSIDVRGLVAPGRAGLYPPSSIFPNRGLVASIGLIPRSLALFQGRGGAGGGGRGGAGGGAPAPAPTPGPGGGRGAPAPSPAPSPTGGRGGPPNPMMNGMNPALGPMSPARNALLKMPDTPVSNQNIMQMLADGTGGFVIRDTNDLFGGLEKIGKELNEYYILGYTPPESEEGTCHVLKVKVDQGGTTVRARTGYCNAKSRDLLTRDMPVEKALESRVAGTQPGNVTAAMQVPFFYTGADIARVNFAMDVPPGTLKFDKQKGKFHAEMDILGIAYKPDGSIAARFSDSVKRDFEDKKQMEAFEKAPFHYENQFDLVAGKYNLKVAFSSGNDKFGKLESPLSIDPWETKQFTMSALALSDEIHKTTDAAASLDQSLLEDRTPLVTAGVQVIPAGSTKFTKAQPPLFYVEVYEPLLTQGTDQKMAVGLQIRVLDRKSGQPITDTGMMRVDLPEKTDRPVASLGERIPVDKLSAGQYTVEVQALSMGGATVKRTAEFDLE
jgi:hypothetical protein